MPNNITYAIIACSVDKGMKSFGSKGLLVFNNKKLLEHQIDWIHKAQNKNKNYEIILVCDFDNIKVEKNLSGLVKIIRPEKENAIFTTCINARYDQICFIDYGCLFNPIFFTKIDKISNSSIITVKGMESLMVGCVVMDNFVQHMFIDLPENKFSNIFYLNDDDIKKIKNDPFFKRYNLLYFEILNRLIDQGSLIETKQIGLSDFMYFTNMRQKNGIAKFIKKIPNKN